MKAPKIRRGGQKHAPTQEGAERKPDAASERHVVDPNPLLRAPPFPIQALYLSTYYIRSRGASTLIMSLYAKVIFPTK